MTDVGKTGSHFASDGPVVRANLGRPRAVVSGWAGRVPLQRFNGQLSEPPFRRMLVHSISADQEMAKLGPISKLNAEMHFLERLRDVGRRHAEGWLTDKFDSLGRESTIELQKEFL